MHALSSARSQQTVQRRSSCRFACNDAGFCIVLLGIVVMPASFYHKRERGGKHHIVRYAHKAHKLVCQHNPLYHADMHVWLALPNAIMYGSLFSHQRHVLICTELTFSTLIIYRRYMRGVTNMRRSITMFVMHIWHACSIAFMKCSLYIYQQSVGLCCDIFRSYGASYIITMSHCLINVSMSSDLNKNSPRLHARKYESIHHSDFTIYRLNSQCLRHQKLLVTSRYNLTIHACSYHSRDASEMSNEVSDCDTISMDGKLFDVALGSDQDGLTDNEIIT